jgi:DNA-binding MarR family transcriptional regulator
MTTAKSRDNEVLQALHLYFAEHGHMPTCKELSFSINIKRGQLSRNLNRLVRRGYLHELPLGTLRYALASEETEAR